MQHREPSLRGYGAGEDGGGRGRRGYLVRHMRNGSVEPFPAGCWFGVAR
jgi:hypothetical protein